MRIMGACGLVIAGIAIYCEFRYRNPEPCKQDEVCGMVSVDTHSRERQALRWLSAALREHPNQKHFKLVERHRGDSLIDDYGVTYFDRERKWLADTPSAECGCGEGWQEVTTDKIREAAAHNENLEYLTTKLGCEMGP